MNAGNAKIWAQKQKQRQKLLRAEGKNKKAGKFSWKSLFLIGATMFFMISLAAFGFYSYRNYQSASALEISGNIITVKAGGDFQSALNRAKPGDTIVLQAGAKFIGSFVLPNKAGSEFVTVQSSEIAKLPPENVRVRTQDAAMMPKILSSGKDEPAIKTAPGAHNYRFVGVEISVNKPEDNVFKLIFIGDDEQKNASQVPREIVFDRCFVHGHAQQTGRVRSGFSINGSRVEILNSYISDFRLKDDEGHAIVAWNAPGPFRIINNYIEAAGVNVLFGGATAQKGMNPADLEFRRNHVAKKLEWRGNFAVKNLFELKDMRRAVIEENIFENNWASAQDGTAIVFTPASLQSGEDARVENITFRSNIVRRTANAISMTGTDYGDPKYPNIAAQNRGVRLINNLFAEIGGKWGERSSGRFLLLTSGAGPDDLTVDHNTIQNTGSLIVFDGGPMKNFVFTNNIGNHNEYGIIGVGNRGGGVGNSVLRAYTSGVTFRKNVIIGADAKLYPADNFYQQR